MKTINKVTKENAQEIGDLIVEKMIIPAIDIIRQESHSIKTTTKAGYSGEKNDLFTNGDIKAQAVYTTMIKKFFPDFGIIAEEGGVHIEPRNNKRYYITVDPLDGTRAYKRGSSHGVGTMISVVQNGRVVSAYVGDVNTGEIYGYSDTAKFGSVYRRRFGVRSILKPETDVPIINQYLLLQESPRNQGNLVTAMIDFPEKGGLFKDIEVTRGSIGTTFAKLWKGEIGGILLGPTYDTPWDTTPVIGISQRMGFYFYKVSSDDSLWRYSKKLIKKVERRDHPFLVIHQTYQDELGWWLNSYNSR